MQLQLISEEVNVVSFFILFRYFYSVLGVFLLVVPKLFMGEIKQVINYQKICKNNFMFPILLCITPLYFISQIINKTFVLMHRLTEC